MHVEEKALRDVGDGKKARPRNEFLDEAQAVFAEVDALPPTAGLLQKWRKEMFKGDGDWMLRCLRDLAPRGALGKGDSYAFKALQNQAAGNGNGRASPAKKLPVGATQEMLDEARLWDEMEGT